MRPFFSLHKTNLFLAAESRALFFNPVKYRTVEAPTNAKLGTAMQRSNIRAWSMPSFMRHSSCGETLLYQIRRGNNGISPNVAKRIHQKY
ncbi:MAG: hypothetical protein ACLTZY_07395, partial [Alistipes indistinctus]